MKTNNTNRTGCTILFLLLTILLTACGHEHTWSNATCTEPKTCSECGLTQGVALGHTWTTATCTEPKTCHICGAVEGDPLGHKWIEATCTEPKTCLLCNTTEGESLSHEWIEATCTDAKRCSVCSDTEGEALGHNYEYTVLIHETCAEKGLEEGICSRCGDKIEKEIPATQEHIYEEWVITEAPSCHEYGKEESYCIKCGGKKVRKVDKLPHVDDNTFVIEENATGYLSGKKATHCKNCGAVVQTASYEIGNVVGTSDYKKMRIGDIGSIDGVLVGLSYVKKMSYLPTALGTKVNAEAGNEVIIAFFDYYNDNRSMQSVHPDHITCYADGIQVYAVDSIYYSECDGVREVHSADLDARTQFLTCNNFEVPKGWQELRFYYDSKCVWTVLKDDVKEKNFTFSSMYELLFKKEETPVDDILSSNPYELIYKGCEIVSRNNPSLGNLKYAIFKYRINNTSKNILDTSLIGYNMRAYQDNYYLNYGPDYIYYDKINGYQNIFNVDSIEAGMSANVYVAFRLKGKGNLCMVFDDGYISSSYKGTVYARYK